MNRIAYLLCELKSRDLESRLLIASHLLRAGCPVVVGQRWSVGTNMLDKAPRGVSLFGTANNVQAQGMVQVRDAGHWVAAADEEALPFAGDGFLINVDPLALTASRQFLVMNDQQRAALQARFPDATGRIATVGSTRVDLLRLARYPRPMAEPYLLFNTNAGLINSIWGNPNEAAVTVAKAGGMDLKDPATAREMTERVQVEAAAYKELVEVIKWAVAHTDINIVIRPHPAEKADHWENTFRHNRIRVVSGTSPGSWLQHAKAVVHCDSTTGLETAILGTPCVNLSPQEAWSKRFLMSQVNHTVRNAQSAVDVLAEFFTAGGGPIAAKRDLDDLLPPGGGARTAAVLLDALEENEAPLPPRFSWDRVLRTDIQKTKFTVSRDEVAASPHVRDAAGIHELDDSVFLLEPKLA